MANHRDSANASDSSTNSFQSHLVWDNKNVKGLTYSHSGEDYDFYRTTTQAIGTDIIGMAKPTPPLSLTHFTGTKHFGATNISFGFPDTTMDPVPETFQSDGSLTVTTGSLVPMSHRGHIMDPTGLRCWSGHTLRGKSNTFLSIFTAYRACSASIGTLPIGSTFSQECEHHCQSQQLVSPRPGKQMIQDLIAVIKTPGKQFSL